MIKLGTYYSTVRGNRQLLSRWAHLSSVFRQVQISNSPTASDIVKQTNINETISTKYQNKLVKREPFVKNFFIGVVDTELLVFPEIIAKDVLEQLHENTTNTARYFKSIIESGGTSEKVLSDLKSLGLFGSDVPQHYGGSGYFITENVLASEPETDNISISCLLNSHRLLTNIITQYGTEEQKLKYLPQLATGDIIGTAAVFESKTDESGSFLTTVTETDSKCYHLTGEKNFVLNGADANLILVVAKVNNRESVNNIVDGICLFLVESNKAGVIKDQVDDTIGCSGLKQCTIHFKNVILTESDMLGTFDTGRKISQVLLNNSRLQSGILCANQMKHILNILTTYCIETKQFGIELKNMELLQQKISKVATNIYALESMVYLTAGLMDAFDDQDVDMECAIVKYFALSSLWQTARLPMDFMGPEIFQSGQKTLNAMKDSAQLYIQGEPLDSVRLYIGLNGLQYSGKNIHETIMKVRNPLFNPKFILSQYFDRRDLENPQLKLNLAHYVHPSLEPPAQFLEKSVLRLQMCSETLLGRHGQYIIEKQVDVCRIADISILLYAMCASISRASRSYCIGLKNANYENLIASIYNAEACETIKSIAIDIAKGSIITCDDSHQKVAKQLFQNKGYFCEHPLTRNF